MRSPRGELRGVRLALDVDGLLQRFGRAVPDGDALLAELSRIRHRLSAPTAERNLEIYLLRFVSRGSSDESNTRLIDDLRSLDLLSRIEALGAETLVLDAAADLSALASAPSGRMGVMLMSGRHQPVAEALRAAIPAYVLSDRRLTGVEQLSVVDAGRVIAEGLRLPTPRPMSDETRKGFLLAVKIVDITDIRARVRAAMRHDPHADWIVIGSTMLLYGEDEELERDLIPQAGVERLRKSINKLALALVPVADERHVEPLFSGHGYTVGLTRETDLRDPIVPWVDYRRRVILPPRRDKPTPSHDPFVLARDFDAGPLPDLIDAAPRIAFETLRPVLPASAMIDLVVRPDGPMITFASPHRTDASEDLTVISYESDVQKSNATSGTIPAHQVRGALALGAALAQRRGAAGALHCLSSTGRLALPMERLVWQGESNRVAAVVRLADSGTPDTTVTATPNLIDRLKRVVGPVAPLDQADAALPTVSIRGPLVMSPAGAANRVTELCADAIEALTT